jgi:hypothetical protein
VDGPRVDTGWDGDVKDVGVVGDVEGVSPGRESAVPPAPPVPPQAATTTANRAHDKTLLTESPP